MSDVPPAGFPPNSGQPWGAPPASAFKRPSRWPTFVALVVGLIGVAVGFVGWFRPVPHDNAPPAKPTYTAQQTADAKAAVCAAVEKFNRAVSVGKSLPAGSDTLVTAVNSRQIFDVFSRHLLTTLAEEPATPADLATAVREVGSSLEEVVIAYQDGLTNSDAALRPILDSSTAAANTIQHLCK